MKKNIKWIAIDILGVALIGLQQRLNRMISNEKIAITVTLILIILSIICFIQSYKIFTRTNKIKEQAPSDIKKRLILISIALLVGTIAGIVILVNIL